ncbi:GLPGLI family protein [Sphingobacterium sp. SGG-5]|uniref:GLPGLI family protein n=1 Tax=Sphingobacterium sp. SGG-5 TaxID=2710881 RepID=UPI0013EA796F|nr:GLPGLI family protein [Sphingobacterium sp. SGG-5]NGM60783.1 GLPGLI family protein [Sphingobacterium sp. SGG-5]
MNRYILLLIALICVELSYAQYAYFGSRGKITFDRTMYTRARMREMMSNSNPNTNRSFRGGRDVSTLPESTTQQMELFFDEDHTLMRHIVDEEAGSGSRSAVRTGGGARGRQGRGATGNAPRANVRSMNAQKTIYQDLKKATSEMQVTIDEKYILSDSLSPITWRFTDEYRNIAGMECRRVNGATKDSLYLIAFYTDQIPVSAGPALSHGLPGMILGLVIPEMHIQYWATEVSYTNDPVPNDWRDKKSHMMTLDEFSDTLGHFFRRRGNTNDSFRRRVLEQLIY